MQLNGPSPNIASSDTSNYFGGGGNSNIPQSLTKASEPKTVFEWVTGMRNTLENNHNNMQICKFPDEVTFFIGGVSNKATTVLGHYPDYVVLAEKMGARTFQIPTKFWNKMSTVEQWGANLKFLYRTMLRGDKIRLATPLNKVKEGSFYQKELNFLFQNGYKVSPNGLWLVK